MWQALRDIVSNAKESLGIEVPTLPDTGAVTDVLTGAGDQVSQAATTATDAAGTAGDAVSGAGEAVAGAGEQITSKLSDLLGRFGG